VQGKGKGDRTSAAHFEKNRVTAAKGKENGAVTANEENGVATTIIENGKAKEQKFSNRVVSAKRKISPEDDDDDKPNARRVCASASKK
jgi:hypothetical protein